MANAKPKLLVIEDEPDLIEIYGSQLTAAGNDLDVALDGIAGLEKMKAGKYDLVLLDLLMPGMDGFAFLDQVRDMPTRKTTLIYAWSNLTQKKHIALAEAKGIDGFLVKSDFTPKMFVERVKEILATKK